MIYYGNTDTGIKRKNNQDYFRIMSYEDMDIAVVCDGMGGAAGGAVASTLAGDGFMRYMEQRLPGMKFENADDIKKLMLGAGDEANSAVYNRANEYAELEGMGTTLVACMLKNGKLYVINAGDSRLYVIRRGKLERVTRDHSLVQELLDLGKITEDEAKNHPYRNYIMRALGTEERVKFDFYEYDDEFEAVMLCSDGLYNYASEEFIERTILSEAAIEEKLDALIKNANENGGGDNITAILFC